MPALTSNFILVTIFSKNYFDSESMHYCLVLKGKSKTISTQALSMSHLLNKKNKYIYRKIKVSDQPFLRSLVPYASGWNGWMH